MQPVRRDIVVVGASAGGLDALRRLARGLNADFRGSIFVVMHTSPESPQILARVMGDAGPIPAAYAFEGEAIEAGRIYVAPRDQHLLVGPGVVRLGRGPKENRFRPAIDPLFRSAAQVFGPRVVGVILTGGLNDGTAGLQAIKRLGGIAIVQKPEEAVAPSMPSSALAHVSVDHCVSLNEIGPLLAEMARSSMQREGVIEVPEDIKIEVNIADGKRAIDAGVEKLGEPSCFACPECHGVLLKLKSARPERFRCHTGHAHTLDTLLAEVSENSDDAIWTALRNLEEEAMLTRHLARHLDESDRQERTKELLLRAREIESRAEVVRQAALKGNRVPSET